MPRAREEAAIRAISLLREIEPIDPPGTAKGGKQRIAENALHYWATSGDWRGVVSRLAERCECIVRGEIHLVSAV